MVHRRARAPMVHRRARAPVVHRRARAPMVHLRARAPMVHVVMVMLPLRISRCAALRGLPSSLLQRVVGPIDSATFRIFLRLPHVP